MVQRRTARWVLNRFERKVSVTEMLSTLKWKTLASRRTIARLSVLYKMRYRLVSHEDAKLQPAGHSYSTRSKEYSYSQPTAIRITTSIPSARGQLQNGINSQGKQHCISNSLAANAISNIYQHFISLRSKAPFQTHLFSFLERSKCSVLSDRPNW